MNLSRVVTSFESYEKVSGNQIKSGYFSGFEINLGHKRFRRDKNATITISGLEPFELYFSGLVVRGENAEGVSVEENLFSKKYDNNEAYFPFTMDGAADSKFNICIKKLDPCSYEIKVERYKNCNGKISLRMESTSQSTANRERFIEEFTRVEYSSKFTKWKKIICPFNKSHKTKDESLVQKERIEFGEQRRKDRLELFHTKQYMTLAALSKYKPNYNAIVDQTSDLIVTYVGPDDLTNMETSLNFIKQQSDAAGIKKRRLIVRADILGERTTHRKLKSILEDFEGKKTTRQNIIEHAPSWSSSDIIIDTYTINFWRYAKEYREEEFSWKVFENEISRRIKALKPKGSLYLVFPSNVSGFGNVFTSEYQTAYVDDESSKDSWGTGRVLKELDKICTNLKQTKHANITLGKSEEFDYDGGYIVITKAGQNYTDSGDHKREQWGETTQTPYQKTPSQYVATQSDTAPFQSLIFSTLSDYLTAKQKIESMDKKTKKVSVFSKKIRHPRHPFIENLFKFSQQKNPENTEQIIEDAKTIRHELNEAGYSYTGAKATFTYTRKWLSNPTISLKSDEGRRITVNLDAPKSAKSSKFLISVIFCIAYMEMKGKITSTNLFFRGKEDGQKQSIVIGNRDNDQPLPTHMSILVKSSMKRCMKTPVTYKQTKRLLGGK